MEARPHRHGQGYRPPAPPRLLGPGTATIMRRRRERRAAGAVAISGHGALVGGQPFLLPHDVDAATSARIRASALSAEELRAELAGLGAHGRVLVLLDACHSG